MDKLKNELIEIDALIYKLDKVLDSSQPNLSGKIRVYFFKSHSTSKDFDPFIVKRSGRKFNSSEYPIRISEKNLTRRAQSRGAFELNYLQVKETLEVLSELLDYRKRLKSIIVEFEQRAIPSIKKNKDRLGQAEDRIVNLDFQVRMNLERENLLQFYKPIGSRIIKK